MSKRMIVVGLDCLEPSLAFEAWKDSMPTLHGLMTAGMYGRMRSVVPPITVPAWQCMATGRDPGVLGVYGFRNRKDYGYDDHVLADGRSVRAPRVWDRLSRAGKRSVLLGVPQTWPPRPLSGVMISGFPLPRPDGVYTYPASLKKEILEVVDYIPDVAEFRLEDREAVLGRIVEITRRRFRLASYLLEKKPWDFFMMVEMGTDRVVHLLWRHADPGHRFHEPGHPLNDAMRDYYALCDGLVGELLAPYLGKQDTAVAVVSDHGARGMQGGVRINEWLLANGYLTLHRRPPEPASMGEIVRKGWVDWSATRAWAEGGYYARVMLNVRGREPHGAVDPADAPSLKEALAEGLASIPDEKGNPLDTRVFDPLDIYKEVRNIPPDLMVVFGDLAWRAMGTVQPEEGASLHVFENDTGPDDANHNWEGVFVLAGDGIPPRGELGPLSILDFAPTVLQWMEQPVPPDLQGRSVLKD